MDASVRDYTAYTFNDLLEHRVAGANLPSWQAKLGADCSESAENLYKVTKIEFRRLTSQLTEDLRAISEAQPLKAPEWRRSDATFAPSKWTADYTSRLDSSADAFGDREWKPFDSTDLMVAAPTRCSPVGHVFSAREPRPRSVPANRVGSARATGIPNSRFANEVTYGRYDTLSPHVISSLGGNGYKSPQMEIKACVADMTKNDTYFADRRRGSPQKRNARDGDVLDGSTSGFQSADSSSSDSESDETTSRSPIFKAANVGLKLVPEKLASRTALEGSRDRSRYDFDASSSKQPEYKFKKPFSPAVMSIDFGEIAERNDAADNLRCDDALEMKMVKKLIRLAKLQLATQKEEDLRYEKARQMKSRRSQSSAAAGSQRTGGDSGSARSYCGARPIAGSRVCCADCQQPACVGDCSLKKRLGRDAGCAFCLLSTCKGKCAATPYECHERCDMPMERKECKNQRPKSCIACTDDHRGKILNANHAIKGRPRSSQATYAFGRTCGNPRDLRPPYGVAADADLITKLIQIGVSPHSHRPRVKSARLRGRSAVLPSKSFFSQRRYSLTGDAAGSQKSRRTRSARK